MIPVLVVGPIVQVLAFGYAANLDVNEIPLLVVDQDRSVESRALVDRFTSSGHFVLSGTVDTAQKVEPWLVDGRAQIVLVIGTGYGEARQGGATARVQIIADGAGSDAAVVGLGYRGPLR